MSKPCYNHKVENKQSNNNLGLFWCQNHDWIKWQGKEKGGLKASLQIELATSIGFYSRFGIHDFSNECFKKKFI